MHLFTASVPFSAVSKVVQIANLMAGAHPCRPSLSEDNALREFVPKHHYRLANSGKPRARSREIPQVIQSVCRLGINGSAIGELPAQSAGWQLHQHQSYRIEQQMQNQDFRQTQSEPRVSCGCNVELFNISPVDCFNVAEKGFGGEMAPVGY